MSMSDIEKIIVAEAQADKLRLETAAKIEKLLSSAQAEGGDIYASLISSAEASAKEKEKLTAVKISEVSAAAAAVAADRARELKQTAAVNIEKAARIICERIIKG